MPAHNLPAPPQPTRAVQQAPLPGPTPASTANTTVAQQASHSLLPPAFQQPAIDLLAFSPSGRATIPNTPAHIGVPQQMSHQISVQNGIQSLGLNNINRNNILYQTAPTSSAANYIDHYQQAAQVKIPDTQGESLSMSAQNNICHPYMFIQRHDIKDNDFQKKFQVRNSISFEEYMHAYLKMLTALNPPFPVIGALKFHLEHMKDISLLSQTKPWEHVRFWTLSLFDSVESGNISWDQTQEIYNEKIRVLELADHLISSNVSICKQYNQGTCPKQYWDIKTHIVELTTQKHLCSYCLRTDKLEVQHPEYKCRAKKGGFRRGPNTTGTQGAQNVQQGTNHANYNQYIRGQGHINNPRFQNPTNQQQQFPIPPQQEGQRFIQPMNPTAQNFIPKN